MQKDEKRMQKQAEGPIGLGFRVPLVIASPWSRGGWVNSEVCDLTSPIQFLEVFLANKAGKKIFSNEITSFRRAVCGDLTSAFRPYNGEQIELPVPVEKIPFLESIHKAQFKALPSGYKKLTKTDMAELNANPPASPYMPKQEPGTRPACAIPYQLYVEGKEDKDLFRMQFTNSNDVFGERAAGAPFIVYNMADNTAPANYVVLPGDKLTDEWNLVGNNYHFRVYGPNGFYREFSGSKTESPIEVACAYQQKPGTKKLSGNIELLIKNTSAQSQVVRITDNAYKATPITQTIPGENTATIAVDLSKSSNW